MTKYRLRVKGSRRAAKPIGGSCSSNPTSIKFRLAAKAQRMAKLSPLIPVDEIKEQPVGDAALLKQLPMKEMSLGERRPKYKSPGSQFDAGYEEPERNEKQQLQKRPELLDQIKEETSPEDKQRLLKREHQIWQILPSHLSSSPPDYKTTMPVLAPILGASLNERPDLRLTALSSIRAALQMDAEHGFNIMEQFAKNFLPILFSLYTNIDAREEQTNASPKFDPQAVHLSTLETIRLFMRQAPKELIKQYIKAAVQKLASEEGNDGKQQQKSGGGGEDADKKLLLADLLIGMCISADIEDIQLVFNCFRSWFGDVGRRQKKAYRLLAQIYQRIDEPELEPFFRSNRPFLAKLIEAGHETVDKSAYQWRIAVYRNVIQTFHIHEFEELSHFCASIDEELFAFLDPENSSPTRQQATNCLVEMAAHLGNLCPSDGPNPLESLFSKLFKTVKATVKSTVEDEDGSNKRLQCALLALNILSQKRIRQANATLLSQLLGHTADALQATDPKNRVLAIRLMRTICAKMQPFMFEQFKDLILHAVFAQSTKDPTVRLRKSNALLLELLLESLGIEELLKFAANKMVWVKMLKNLEKRRRRRQRKGQKMGNGDLGTMLPSAGSGRRSSRSGASTVVSSAQSSAAASSAISSLITLGARTAHVDSIFDLLEDSSDEEAEKEQGRKSARQRRNSNRKSARLSVVLEEGAEEDDPLDLLDRKAVQSRLTLVKKNTKMEMNKKKRKLGTSEEEEEEEEQMDGPFRRNKEGKLLITDLDEKRQTKRRRKAEKEVEEGEEEDEEKGDEQKNGRVEGDEDLDEDE